jgi:hypothetical protein
MIIGDKEVETFVAAFDATLAEATRLRGHMWVLSGQLVKHVVSQQA